MKNHTNLQLLFYNFESNNSFSYFCMKKKIGFQKNYIPCNVLHVFFIYISSTKKIKNMRKKNLLFIPFILIIGIGLYSCMGETNNTITFGDTPAVVCQDILESGGTTIGVAGTYLAAPSLTDVHEGECLLLNSLTIDYDNQPSDKYVTATNIVKETVEQKTLEQATSLELKDYTLPISTVSGNVNPYYQGRIFIWASCKDKNPDFRFIYKFEEDESNHIKDLYLLAKPSSSSPNSSDVTSLHAFNLSNFIFSVGRDTTIVDTNTMDEYNFKYIKANLKYLSGISEEGEPEYKSIASSFEMYVFN